MLFTGSLLIEVIFSLDGLGLLGFEAALNRDYPVMFGTLYIFTLDRAGHEARRRPHLHPGRPAHRLRGRAADERGAGGRQARDPARAPRPQAVAADPAPAAHFPRQPARLLVAVDLFVVLFVVSLFAEFIANDRPLLVPYDGRLYFPVFVDYPGDRLRRRLPDRGRLQRPGGRGSTIEEKGWMVWPPIPFSYDTIIYDLRGPRPRRRRAAICSAPTTRRATCWRGSSMASASRSCSASR